MSNPFYTLTCSLLLASNALFANQPTTEWIWHKTSDGQHPNGEEQTQIWLMNRARQNPAAEGRWLAEEEDIHVTADRWIYGVDTDLLQTEFANFAAKPPAAFDVRLYQAAAEHNQHMIAVDRQTHDGQVDRANSQGLTCKAYHGNVFSHSKNALHAHVGYNIDWGDGPGGMQQGRLHRLGIMSLDGIFSNVGIASIRETNSNTRVGPWVTTGNFCDVDDTRVDHHNRFIVGTVWEDKNKNGR
ncbi:MAG: hypothetical protein KAG66_14940, partial [Methylococcales bacterium]|nr:hypothetical protein [Methylococcales bacterium]